MRYVARVLQPDETVVLHTRLHPIIYLYALWYLAIVVLLFIASFQVNSVEIHTILQVAALIFLLFALVAWLRAAIRQWTTELAVTDRRVIYKSGLISRHTLEMNRSKIESVDVDQVVARPGVELWHDRRARHRRQPRADSAWSATRCPSGAASPLGNGPITRGRDASIYTPGVI